MSAGKDLEQWVTIILIDYANPEYMGPVEKSYRESAHAVERDGARIMAIYTTPEDKKLARQLMRQLVR